MPLYTCHCPEDLLNDDQRVRIAEAITDIHCSLTTAPRTFVHVQFRDRVSAEGAPMVALSGGIRAGRPAAVTASLVEQISGAVGEIGGVAPEQITMRTVETPASWILEGGRVLPEPGQEEAWMEASAHPV